MPIRRRILTLVLAAILALVLIPVRQQLTHHSAPDLKPLTFEQLPRAPRFPAAATVPAEASRSTRALILYDVTGRWGYLGGLYATMTANLVGHFGAWSAEPAAEYRSGQMEQYSALIYVGSTYGEQNHPVLVELCRRHGRDLNFVGCVVFGGTTVSSAEKEASSSAVSKIARLLRADAAMITGLNGSNHAVDLMLTIQKCERAGIKTTLIYNDVGEGPDDPGFIFAVPEADAIVSAGSRVRKVTLPKLERLIGGEHLVDPYMDARGDLTVPLRYLCCSIDATANTRQMVRFE
jgi:hypothetical protein